MALVAILQLGVTMDYSIFLYHSNKYKQVNPWSKFQKFEENAPTGIGTIENAADEANMVCDIYALSGVKVATGVYANLMHSGTLPAGIYVARFANGTAKKLIVK